MVVASKLVEYFKAIIKGIFSKGRATTCSYYYFFVFLLLARRKSARQAEVIPIQIRHYLVISDTACKNS
jgi:hypothetical protein